MLLKWFAWHINSEFVPFNHLVKSALLEPIEPMILQSSHCVKSEQEAATVFEIRQKTREVNPFIPTLRMVTHWLMVHSDPSSRGAEYVSACQHCCQALFFDQALLHDLRDFYTILRDFCAILHDFYTILCNFCDVFARHKLSAARHLKLLCRPVDYVPVAKNRKDCVKSCKIM